MPVSKQDIYFIEKYCRQYFDRHSSSGDDERNTMINIAILEQLEKMTDAFNRIADKLEEAADAEVKNSKKITHKLPSNK